MRGGGWKPVACFPHQYCRRIITPAPVCPLPLSLLTCIQNFNGTLYRAQCLGSKFALRNCSEGPPVRPAAHILFMLPGVKECFQVHKQNMQQSLQALVVLALQLKESIAEGH